MGRGTAIPTHSNTAILEGSVSMSIYSIPETSTSQESEFIYYVYAYLRKRDGTPYYIERSQGI